MRRPHETAREYQPAFDGTYIQDTRTREVFRLLGWHISADGKRISAYVIRPQSIPAEFVEELR